VLNKKLHAKLMKHKHCG